MTSTLNVDKIMNVSGDQDSGVDLQTNDQVKIKTANTDRITVTDATTTIANNLHSAGTVIQVLQAFDNTAVVYTTGNSWVDLGALSVSITPKFSSSKILVSCQIGCVEHSANSYLVAFKYLRGSTVIGNNSAQGIGGSTGIRGQGSGDVNAVYGAVLPQFLDSPNTTSATTYKVQYNNYNGQSFYYLRDSGNNENYVATLTVMEIAQWVQL